MKESNRYARESVVRPQKKKKSENCILGFPSQDSCPGFISGDRYCRSIIRAAVSNLGSVAPAEVCRVRIAGISHRKKLPFCACVLAFELIGSGAPRTAAEVTTNSSSPTSSLEFVTAMPLSVRSEIRRGDSAHETGGRGRLPSFLSPGNSSDFCTQYNGCWLIRVESWCYK